jgi:hypothetical protein
MPSAVPFPKRRPRRAARPTRAALAASPLLASGLAAPDPGTGIAYPTQAAEPRAEYVAGGLASGLPDARQVLSQTVEEVAVEFGGDRLWDMMENDPTIASALASVAFAAVPGDLRIMPAVEPHPDPQSPAAAERAAVADEARDAADLCIAATCAMERPAEAVLVEMAVDALKYGAELSEMVWRPIDDGDYRGLLGLAAIKVKPRNAWQFVVDPYNNVVGYLVRLSAGAGWAVLPPEKFFVTAWGRRKGDPRGRPVLRPAFNAWNILRQLWPEFFYFLQRFASPGLVGISAPGESARPASSAGVPVAGEADVAPESDFLAEILKFQKGKAIAVPNGADLKALETKASGDAFLSAVDLLKREMTQAILLAVRATMESKHGSKADSETAQDLMGLVTGAVRTWLCREYRRQVLYPILLYNRGKEVADRATPLCSFGDSDQQDQSKMWEAYGFLVQSNAPLTRSQHIKTQVKVGLPAPEPGEEVVDMTPPAPAPAPAPADAGQGGDGQAQGNPPAADTAKAEKAA